MTALDVSYIYIVSSIVWSLSTFNFKTDIVSIVFLFYINKQLQEAVDAQVVHFVFLQQNFAYALLVMVAIQ